MEIAEHISILEDEGRLLVGAARAGDLDAPVPTCPDWRLRDLLSHIGFVHRWAASYVRHGHTEMVDEPAEMDPLAAGASDEAICDWVAAGHAALVRALGAAPADLRCWTFLDAPSPLAMWARRQAHETTVHRVDAELAVGRSLSPIGPAFAADGVDELLVAFLGRSAHSVAGNPLVGSIALVAEDRPESWTLRVLDPGFAAVRGAGPADLVVRAPAADLYLLMWNRAPAPAASGRLDLFDRWRDRFGVTWR